jgi:hypothetical protein
MAISDSQKVDYLWKKIAYGKTKTDLGTTKQGFEESISSPLLIRGDRIWQRSDLISASIATSSTVVTVYSGATTVECTEDTSAADNRTWKTNLTDWISPEFGADYIVSVYIANSGITGSNKTTQVTISANKITAAGVTSPTALDDQWYFDYQSGVLHFIGTNIPTGIGTGVTGKSVYITGARYTGDIGLGTTSSSTISNANLGNLNITGNTISSVNTNDSIVIDPNGTGNVTISGNLVADDLYGNLHFSSGNTHVIYISSSNTATHSSKFTFNDTSNVLAVGGNIDISTNYYLGNGYYLSGLDATKLSGTANLNQVNINSSGDANYGAISLGNATIAANTTSGAAGIFTGIGSSAISNITIGTSSSTVKVPGTLATGSIVGNSANITITTGTLIDTFSVSTYRTAKYIIKVSNSTTYEALEALVIHDGSDSYITVYGYISSDDTDIVSVSTNISGGNVNLYASRIGATTTVLNYLATYIKD